jgi:hypothetical protein
MTPGINFVFVPYPVPVSNGVGWEKRAKPAPYPREGARGRWPLTSSVLVRDLRATRDLIAQAKRIVAEDRASKLLRELDGRQG